MTSIHGRRRRQARIFRAARAPSALSIVAAGLATALRLGHGASRRGDASRRNAELAKAVAAAELAEEVAGLGRWTIGLPDGDLYWSRGTYVIHGLDPADGVPTRERAIGFYHPDDRAIVDAAVQAALTSDRVVEFTHRLVRADGALRHVAVKSKRVTSEDGALSLVGVIQDVTDQVAAAQAVRDSEERFRTLAANVSDVIVHAGRDGRITYASPAVEAISGYTAEELVGRLTTDLMPDEDVAVFHARFSAAVADRSRKPWTLEYRIRRRDGEIRWVQARPRLVRDARTGKATGVVDVVRDVTEAKRAEGELQASEARYRLIADHVDDVILRMGLDGTALYCSPSVRLWGYRPEELVGRSMLDLVHPDDRGHNRAWLHAVFAGTAEPATQRRTRVLTATGDYVWFEGAPSLVRDADGRPVEVVSVLRDVTAQLAIEHDLIAARNAAEEAAAAKGEFLANMSHELRTPLNSIVGFASLIAEAPELAPETRRRARLVADASRSLVAIVNDILDLSKLEAQGVSLDLQPVELDLLLRSACELVRGEAEGKGLDLRLDLPPATAPVLVDPTRVRQVVLNLLSNAVKFTEAGQVVLSLSRDRRGRAKIAVRDTGVGIAPERLAQVFERFAQGDTSTSRRFGGSGLGLTISRLLVEAMGGKLGVDSVEGAGSTFWFTLDGAETAASPFLAAEAAHSTGSARGRRVLLADDNEVNRDLFVILLEASGIEITAVENGAEAVRAVQAAAFDAVFMDMQMPVMDGLEAARTLRRLGFVDLPIIALTASVLQTEIDRCRAAGMNDHLGKPYTPAEVLATLDRWVGAESPAYADGEVSEAVLDRLEASIGATALDGVLDGLVAQLQSMSELLAAADAGREALGPRLHSARGLAGTLGFTRVAGAYAELEAACRSGDGDELDARRTAAQAATVGGLAELTRRRAAR